VQKELTNCTLGYRLFTNLGSLNRNWQCPDRYKRRMQADNFKDGTVGIHEGIRGYTGNHLNGIKRTLNLLGR